jgi:hypothetical protein
VDDVEMIKQLKARYFRTMDTKDWSGMRSVFTDDVIMDTTASGGGVIAGADEFLTFLQPTLGEAVTVHRRPPGSGLSRTSSSGRTGPACWASATTTRPTRRAETASGESSLRP